MRIVEKSGKRESGNVRYRSGRITAVAGLAYVQDSSIQDGFESSGRLPVCPCAASWDNSRSGRPTNASSATMNYHELPRIPMKSHEVPFNLKRLWIMVCIKSGGGRAVVNCNVSRWFSSRFAEIWRWVAGWGEKIKNYFNCRWTQINTDGNQNLKSEICEKANENEKIRPN